MAILEYLLTITRKLARIFAALLFAYMLVAILTQVVGRYLSEYVSFSIAWTEESARFAQIWMVLLGTGIAMQNKMHVGVDILMRHLPRVARKILLTVTSLCCLIFLYCTASSSFLLIEVGKIQTSSAMGVPLWIVYWSMPIGLGYFALEFILDAVKTFRKIDEEAAS